MLFAVCAFFAKAQTLMANPNLNKPVFSMVTNGDEILFMKVAKYIKLLASQTHKEIFLFWE